MHALKRMQLTTRSVLENSSQVAKARTEARLARERLDKEFISAEAYLQRQIRNMERGAERVSALAVIQKRHAGVPYAKF